MRSPACSARFGPVRSYKYKKIMRLQRFKLNWRLLSKTVPFIYTSVTLLFSFDLMVCNSPTWKSGMLLTKSSTQQLGGNVLKKKNQWIKISTKTKITNNHGECIIYPPINRRRNLARNCVFQFYEILSNICFKNYRGTRRKISHPSSLVSQAQRPLFWYRPAGSHFVSY